MGFCGTDPLDKRHRERIRALEAELHSLATAFENCTSLTQAEKMDSILHARKVLEASW